MPRPKRGVTLTNMLQVDHYFFNAITHNSLSADKSIDNLERMFEAKEAYKALPPICWTDPSLKKNLLGLVDLLKENPETGASLGNNCYKIRMAISSKSKGKSGGARIITHIVVADQFVYLLSIYDKSEKADLTDGELKQLLKGILQ